MSIMTVQQILEAIEELSPEEQKTVSKALKQRIKEKKGQKPRYSVLDFIGIGKQWADGTDAQERVNQLRAEWDREDA